MDPTVERKLKEFSTQVSEQYLNLGPTPPAPRNRESDRNQVPSEKMVMGADLTLAPPATAEDNTSHDLQAPDEVLPVSRPIAPSYHATGLYWCEECQKLTSTTQWYRGSTDKRDLCSKHYQKSRKGRRAQ